MVNELRAVFVGVNTYQDSRLRERQLHYARADAEELASTLHNSHAFYVNDQLFQVFTNEHATQENVWRSLHSAFPSSGSFDKNSIALFYFAGHSFIDPIDETSILLGCHNVVKANPHSGGIRLNDIYNLLLRSNAGCSIAIIDSCYSGGILDTTRISNESPVERAMQGVALQRGGSDRTLAIFTACRPNEEAREDKSLAHGVYTYEILQCLCDEGEARDEQGIVDLSGLAQYLNRRFEYDPQRPRSSVLSGTPVAQWRGNPRVAPSKPVEPRPAPPSKTYVGTRDRMREGTLPKFTMQSWIKSVRIPAAIVLGFIVIFGLLAALVEPVRFGFFVLTLVLSMLFAFSGFILNRVLGALLVLGQVALLIGVGYNHFHWFAFIAPLTGTLHIIGGLEWLFWTITIIEFLLWVVAFVLGALQPSGS